MPLMKWHQENSVATAFVAAIKRFDASGRDEDKYIGLGLVHPVYKKRCMELVEVARLLAQSYPALFGESQKWVEFGNNENLCLWELLAKSAPLHSELLQYHAALIALWKATPGWENEWPYRPWISIKFYNFALEEAKSAEGAALAQSLAACAKNPLPELPNTTAMGVFREALFAE